MSPWFGWVMDARLHLALIVALIAAAIGVNDSMRASESNWRAKQVATLRQRTANDSGAPTALARAELFTTNARSAEGR